MRLTSVDGRSRKGELTREIAYQKVLLAVYLLSDERGLECDVPVLRIASESGQSIRVAQRSIGMMLERGDLLSIDQRDGLNRRVLVLADHPEARDWAAYRKRAIKEKSEREFQEQVRRRVERRTARSSKKG